MPRTVGSHLALPALAAFLGVAGPAVAAWPPSGLPLCSVRQASQPRVAPDGAGGAFVVWWDRRNDSDGTNHDIYLQRVTAAGELSPGWPADGIAISTAPLNQSNYSPVSDGSGGVIIVWEDRRDALTGPTGADIYAQRILADGSIAPGWPVNGAPVTRAPGTQTMPTVAADGAGGAFFTWHDENASDIYLQYLTSRGEVAPDWPANGLPICILPSAQGGSQVMPDGLGGVFVAWGDFRDGLVAIYAQRVTAAGSLVPGWPPNGVQIVLDRYIREIVSDGAGGAYVSCATAGSLDAAYYLQRFTGDGTIAPGWPAGGVPVCQAPDERQGLRMVPDGVGGVVLAWGDYRDNHDEEIFALRMRLDGTRYPGWPLDGVRVTNYLAFDSFPDLCPDGASGAYVCWQRQSGPFADRQVLVQHLTAGGTVAAGWPANGRAVPTSLSSGRPHIVEDGAGGAIAAWEDVTEQVRALRFSADTPVAVEVSLVSAEAEPGLVRLTWFAADVASLIASVDRRTRTSDWERLGSITADGTGRLVYEDRAVTPGTRYGYRLTYRDGAALIQTAETWVEVPALRFALRGLTPNPSAGDPMVAFSLSSAERAWIELFDLTGRLVLSREVGALGAGSHEVRLGERGRLPAGVYTVRLRQGEQVARARAVFIR